MVRKAFAIGAALTLLPALALAADAQVDAARQCAQQKDSLQRLVCYDRIFQSEEAAPAARAPAVAPAAAAPVVAAAPVAAAAAPAAAVAASTVAPTVSQPAPASLPRPAAPPVAVAATAAPAQPALGDEAVKKKDKAAEAAVPRSLEAKVTAVRESRPETFRVTLDNGQIWQQMESSSLFHVKNGDAVRIEKGSMGGYRMALAKGSGWVRVTRVE